MQHLPKEVFDMLSQTGDSPEGEILRELHRLLCQQHEDARNILLVETPSVRSGAPFKTDFRNARSRGSRAMRDARQGLLYSGGALANMLSASLLDHVWALTRIIADDEHVSIYSPISVARIAVESAWKMQYLHAPEGDWQTRLLRIARELNEDVAREMAMANDYPDRLISSEFTQKARERQQHIDAELRTAGIEVTGKEVRLSVPKYSIPKNVNLTEQINKLFVDLPIVYRIGSGAVHGNLWYLRSIMVEDKSHPTGVRPRPQVEMIGAAVEMAVAACEMALRAYGVYFLEPVDDALQKAARIRHYIAGTVGHYLSHIKPYTNGFQQ
ncbi:hypothetical protein [Actinomadura sp. 3N508]|uniref:hypothetical protein n=1 Tax=Actinomadura sp. 3N508 TaxID=3375153 RepID=UPI0037BCFB38